MRVNGFSWEAGGALGETLIGQRGEAPGGAGTEQKDIRKSYLAHWYYYTQLFQEGKKKNLFFKDF